MEGNAEKQNKKRNDKKNKKIIFFEDNDSYLDDVTLKRHLGSSMYGKIIKKKRGK